MIAATGRETVDEMRTLLGVLRSTDEPGSGDGQAALKPQPGLADLEQLVSGVREAGLPLTNALKHAGPARAEVTVRYEDGLVSLEITDSGCGPHDGGGTGHGLVGMRERAAMFGGKLDAAQGDGGGFTVRARLPVPAPASA